MRRLAPLLLAAGVALLAGGFLYDILYAGIPYQDPTPELAARYARDQATAGRIMACGATLAAAGAIVFSIRKMRRGAAPPGNRDA